MSSERKRVALFLPNLAGGGAERVALAIAKDLIAIGHEVDLVLAEATGELLELLPPEVNIVNLGVSRYRSTLRPLVRYLKDRKPDALQAIMWPMTIIAAIAHRLARSRARLVLTDQVALSQHYVQPVERAVLKATTRLIYPLADARTFCSAMAAEDLVRLSGLPRDSFEVIFNPVLDPGPIPQLPEVEALWGEGRPRIITVGSFKHQKNHALLIRAFAKLKRRREAKLMILGEGPLRPMLEALAREEGVADSVLLPGFAVDPWPYYASADLFVLSSDYEGFGNVLVEALRAGLPIVSTDCESGPREILDGGRYGRLVPCGDEDSLAQAMAEVLDAPADPGALKARAEEVSGQPTIDRYRELMIGTGGSRP